MGRKKGTLLHAASHFSRSATAGDAQSMTWGHFCCLHMATEFPTCGQSGSIRHNY